MQTGPTTDSLPLIVVKALIPILPTAIITYAVTVLAIRPEIDAQHELWRQQASLEMRFEMQRDKISYAQELIGIIHRYQVLNGQAKLATYELTLDLALWEIQNPGEPFFEVEAAAAKRRRDLMIQIENVFADYGAALQQVQAVFGGKTDTLAAKLTYYVSNWTARMPNTYNEELLAQLRTVAKTQPNAVYAENAVRDTYEQLLPKERLRDLQIEQAGIELRLAMFEEIAADQARLNKGVDDLSLGGSPR
jgi:hypothetical protein